MTRSGGRFFGPSFSATFAGTTRYVAVFPSTKTSDRNR
jgi:hypothetical protein